MAAILGAENWSLAVLAAVLLASAATDLRAGKIYNFITYPAIAIGLIGHTLTGGLTGYGGSSGLAGALGGLAAGFLPMLVAYMMGGIGGGDAKLMAAVGALGGWRFALASMFYGFAVAMVIAVVVMVRRRIVRRTLGRIWRFAFLSMTPARGADPAAADSPKIPFGFALCVGAALAILEVLLRGPLTTKLIGI